MNKKKGLISLIAMILFFMITPAVFAHVTVHPQNSTVKAYEKYTMRVPVEKEMNTTAVTLRVPKKVTFVSVLPVSGWDYQFVKDDDGQITAVTWTAKDDGIQPNEFAEFAFIAANPGDAGEISWEAEQKYADGSVVKWDGEPDTSYPASVTMIQKTSPEQQANQPVETGSQPDDQDTASSANWITTVIAALALLLAIIGLFRKRN